MDKKLEMFCKKISIQISVPSLLIRFGFQTEFSQVSVRIPESSLDEKDIIPTIDVD
jgi:hypothetical protein